MDVDGDAHVVGGHADALERAEDGAKLRQIAAALAHELVGRDAGVRVRLGEGAGDVHHQFPHVFRDSVPAAFALDTLSRLVHALDAQRGGEHGRAILVAARELCLLQPCDRGLDAVVVGGAIALELPVAVLDQYFPGGRDHGVFLRLAVPLAPVIEPAKCAQHGLDVALLQMGARCERELLLRVVVGEQQQASRGVAVPAGAAGLLQVALERPGDLGVDHGADVGLVDAHAERVRRDHHVDLAVVESPLYLALALGRQAGMEVLGAHAPLRERLRRLLGAPLGRAVDDRAAGARPRERVLDGTVDVLDPLRGGGRRDHELEVGPLGPAVDHLQPRSQGLFEVPPDLVDHIALGGGGQAQDRRRQLAVLLGDVARHVPVVRTEVVSPLRQAVGFVQDPGSDSPPGQGVAERTVAQLLGGDQNDAGVAEAYAGQRVGAFRPREQAVMVVAQPIPSRRMEVTWSAISATSGEMTTVSAPLAS